MNKDFTNPSMWKFISLSDLEYKNFNHTIGEFLSDIDKLILLQNSGHVPLILSQQNESNYHVRIAPHTLETLSTIDSSFLAFRGGATHATIDAHIIETHDLLLGDKETFKNHITRKAALEEVL